MTKTVAETDDDADLVEHVSVQFLDVFDRNGQLREVSAEEVAGLSPRLQEEWRVLNAAASTLKAAEAALAENTQTIHRLASEEAILFNELRQLEPPVSPIAAARAAAQTYRTGKSAAIPQPKLSPELQKKIATKNEKLDQTSAQLTEARSLHYSKKSAVDLERGKYAQAIFRWQDVAAPPKKTHRELMADVNRAVANDHVGRARKEAEAAAQPASALDAIMRGHGGKRGRSLTLTRRGGR